MWGRVLVLVALAACDSADETAGSAGPPEAIDAIDVMVDGLASGRGVHDERVLRAMRSVPRHEFVPERLRGHAYEDRALPIGHEQSISPPYIVAIMAELAELGPNSKVLEIGTGSGYGAAVLAELAGAVYTIEILEPLAKTAEATLTRLGYDRVHVRHGDGYRGWPEAAPFDAIIVTAAPPHVPEPLRNQLKLGGRLVLPVGERHQEIRVITRTKDGYEERPIFPARFEKMKGEAAERR